MSAFFPALRDDHIALINDQSIFFVGTAPLAADGHVSVSPKGYDTFRVIDSSTVAYLDLTGSGAETAAHLAENGRITVMVCSFGAKPLILRMYGRGETVLVGEARYAELAARFDDLPGARAVVVISIDQVQTSCGYAVPRMEVIEERPRLIDWANAKDADELNAYRVLKNSTSIDGLPSLGEHFEHQS